MRTRDVVGLALAAVLVLLSGFLLYLSYIGSLFGGCEIVRLREVPSPSGAKSVVIFRKECGATVPYNTQASIVRAGDSFAPERTPAFFVIRGIQDIQATWSGERIVRIGAILGADTVYKRDQSVGDIRVEYE